MITHLENINSWDILFDILCKIPKFSEGKSILQIGVKEKEHGVHNWKKMFKKFADHGYENFDVLEIWEPNLNELTGQYLNKKILGDVRNIDKLIENVYDTIFWWHGPEHVTKDEFCSIDEKFKKFTSTFMVLGCPWGEFLQGEVGGNFYEKHLYHWQPQELEKLGYEIYTTDFQNRKDIIGIKYIEG